MGTLRIAYLNSHYPALSHTFIEREVREVRRQGLEVDTFSIRRPGKADLLGPHREEAERTFYLLVRWPLVRALAVALLTRPLGLLRTVLAAQRLSPPGMKTRLLHCAYAAEAVLLAQELERRSLRHVHVHMANNGASVALLAGEFDSSLSYSLTIHGSAEFFDVKGVCLKAKAEKAVFVRCISNFCRAQVMAWTDPSVWPRFHVVHTGLDVDAFHPSLGGRNGSLRILTVGRIDPMKGYHLLMEALNRLSGKGIDWRWDLVGDGPQRKSLERLAVEHGIQDRIRFSGAVGQDAIQDHYDRADLMVVSSFMEGVPVVLMEAMAKGLAVISTNVAGIPELIDPGTGLLVVPGSAEALAAALERAARDPEFLRIAGRRSRQKIAEEFSIRSVGHQMVDLFHRYLKGAARGPGGTAA